MRPTRAGSATPAVVDMAVQVGSVALPNPVMTASGTSGHGAELGAYFDLSRLGAVVVKSLSARPWAGNPAPRLLPVAAGMLNSVGLHNIGIDAWLERDLPALVRAGARVVVSVWGQQVADYAEVGERLARALGTSPRREVPTGGTMAPRPAQTGGRVAAEAVVPSGEVVPAGEVVPTGGVVPAGAVVAVEANISCPNVEDRQRMFSHSVEGAQAALAALVGALAPTGLPVWAKLSPNVTDLVAIAEAVLSAGAGGLTLVNTMMGLAIDPATGRARLGGGGGGLSGPALHPVAVRAVFECRRALPEVPIVGVGGIVTGADAAELLAAGANAVQVGTAIFADPRAPAQLVEDLSGWCAAHGVERVSDLTDRAQRALGATRRAPAVTAAH